MERKREFLRKAEAAYDRMDDRAREHALDSLEASADANPRVPNEQQRRHLAPVVLLKRAG
jgi:dsDNA-binding SOS-regulon protein